MAAPQVISLGIGSPASIEWFITFGLGAGAAVVDTTTFSSTGIFSPKPMGAPRSRNVDLAPRNVGLRERDRNEYSGRDRPLRGR